MAKDRTEGYDMLDRVYGTLVAGGVGDALGAPVEGWYWTEIREKHGKLDRFLPFHTGYSEGNPGCFTDDSVLRYYLALCIIEKGGRVNPDDWGAYWAAHVNTKRLWRNEEIIRIKLAQGMNPWFAGQGGIPAGCASMMIAPVGIVNAGNPAQAYQDGMNIAGVNQSGDNQTAAASVAAAQAEALRPGATVDSVIGAMYDYSSEYMRRTYDLTMDLARSSEDVDSFAAKFYDKMLDWSWPQPKWNKEHYFCGNSQEFVPVCMAILHLCGGEVNRCLIEGANFGRDCDTIAAVVGGIAGGMHGAGAIRREWIEQCEAANAGFYEEAGGSRSRTLEAVARELVDVLKQEQAAAAVRAKELAQMLAE